MKIKDLYWKWKLALHRNKHVISATISICLTVLLIVGVAFAVVNILHADALRKAKAEQYVEESPLKVVRDYDYGTSGFRNIAENEKYILSVDFTTGEFVVISKETNQKWYSNPQDRANDKIIPIKARLSSQIIVNFINQKTKSIQTFDNVLESINKGGLAYELIEDGVKFTFTFPQYGVIIPVQYKLCEDGLLAEVLVSEIQEVWPDGYLVESIEFLPFFGAGGFEDDGYLFIPDGSGSLIDFNSGKQRTQAYNAEVYHTNLTINKETQETVREKAMMPVFGIKSNDQAFLSVVTSGEICTKLFATTSRKTSSYNQAYPIVVLREHGSKGNDFGTTYKYAYYGAMAIKYSDNLMGAEDYSVRYFLMEGENANYSGMSNLYRDYLKENNKLKDSPLADKDYLVLDLYGAVSIEKYVFGVKTPVVTALTKYNEVCEIVRELKSKGVENLIINYVGALDGGLNNKMVDEVKTESVLGTKKEFNAMIEYLKQEGVILFLETNPVDLHKTGNGYMINRDCVKTFFDRYGFQYEYRLDSDKQIADSRWQLLTPQLIPDFIEGFTESAIEWNVNNVSFDRIGEFVYSNYDEKLENYISRKQTVELWTKALANIAAEADYVMLHGGNSYVTPYADVITDVSDTHSNFDMQNQSIPFYQMTHRGNIVMTGDPINTTVDYQYAFLKSIENGCSIKFNLIYGNIEELVGTEFNDIVSYSYEYWKDVAVDEYLKLQSAMKGLAGEEIVFHDQLTDDVALTRYESGGEVIVNYGEKPYSYMGYRVEPRNYIVLQEGAA